MAPIKLEDNMRERLEERTIEPTMAAWDRISSKLDAEQGSKKNKRIWWLSIAASFVGGALIAIMFFQNSEINQGSTLVESNEEKKENIFVNPDEVIAPDTNVIEEKEDVLTLEEGTIKEEIEKKSEERKPSPVKQEVIAVTKQQKTSEQNFPKTENEGKVIVEKPFEKVEEVVASKEVNEQIKPEVIVNDPLDAMISQKVKEVVAQVNDKESITDAEIEALLKNAQREIISKQIFNQKTNKVDANALLLDVEAEVAPASFRNKIFDALTDGFERARDAVANRNN